MNSEQYEKLKEFVITLNNDALFNLHEILIDEINARKMEREAAKIRNKEQNAD